MSAIVVATFYKFIDLPDYRQLQPELLAYCREREIKGTILLASEGVNATIAGKPGDIDSVLQHLRADPRLADICPRLSEASEPPFRRLKVRLKREIVTLGQPQANPARRTGKTVSPREWNRLLQDPDVVVVDTRNDYEVAIGSFRGAVNPATRHFREFPQYVDRELDPGRNRKVAMFCTGGIRCEKASSYMLEQGFEEVYQLQGGILNYLENVPPEQSYWDGECFVFDERVAVNHGLKQGDHVLCQGCGHPVSTAEQQTPEFEQGVSCPNCHADLTSERRTRLRERERQRQTEAAAYKGDDMALDRASADQEGNL